MTRKPLKEAAAKNVFCSVYITLSVKIKAEIILIE